MPLWGRGLHPVTGKQGKQVAESELGVKPCHLLLGLTAKVGAAGGLRTQVQGHSGHSASSSKDRGCFSTETLGREAGQGLGAGLTAKGDGDTHGGP